MAIAISSNSKMAIAISSCTLYLCADCFTLAAACQLAFSLDSQDVCLLGFHLHSAGRRPAAVSAGCGPGEAAARRNLLGWGNSARWELPGLGDFSTLLDTCRPQDLAVGVGGAREARSLTPHHHPGQGGDTQTHPASSQTLPGPSRASTIPTALWAQWHTSLAKLLPHQRGISKQCKPYSKRYPIRYS